MGYRRVLYVIDHQRPGRNRWLKPEMSTTSVEATGDQAAEELAARFGLAETWAGRDGRRVRVRVWPEPEDLPAFDPAAEAPEGSWTSTPAGIVRAGH